MRRNVSIIAACLLIDATSVARAAAAPLPFELKRIGEGVYAAIDGPEHKAGSNAGFVVGDDAVLVVDSFLTAEAARALVAQIHLVTHKPIRYLVNTHYHIDHTGGDQVLRDEGAVIIAHRNVRGWVRTNNITLVGDRITPELRRKIERLPLPDLVTANDLVIWLGSRKIVVRTVLGHTGGDLVIEVPDARVVFTGDLLWRKVPPNLIDGSVKEWAASDDAFLHMANAANHIFVPGHGGLATLDDVRDFRAYLLNLEELVRETRSTARSQESLVQTIVPKLRARHPDWTISDRAVSSEVRSVVEELAGTKHRPVPQPD